MSQAGFNSQSDGIESTTNPMDHHFFSAGGAAKRCIEETLKDAHLIRLATAYFEMSGYQTLQETLAGKKIHLLVGRNEGGRDNVAEVLNEFEMELSTGSLEKRTRAARILLEALQQGLMAVGVGEEAFEQSALMDARYLYQHAKIYIADERAMVIGSANFSYHGLVSSREAGIRIEKPEDVAFFVHRFDEYFAKAQSITQEIIRRLMDWLKAYDPFLIYARALLELYGLPEEDAPESLPPLAPYQRAVVSSILAALQAHRGAFLIASTGLGKTYIAAHTVAYLRMQDEIDNVLIACPAGIKEIWRRIMHQAKTVSEEFSYHTFSGKDKARDSGVNILEHELKYINDKSLIILDESHHLRNEDGDEGEIRLRNQRIHQAVRERKARVLLMTATPYSKDHDDVNNQLKLLPSPVNPNITKLGLSVFEKNWHIEQLSELTDLPPCTVLTTPDVVQHFGKQDENQERFVEFATDDRRYFPRNIILRTIRYQNPLDEFLVELLTSDLLYKKAEASEIDQQQKPLFDEVVLEKALVRKGLRDPLLETNVLYQFCSSPARVKIFCDQIEQGGFNFQFEFQERLVQSVKSHRGEVERASRPKHDEKLSCLVEIIENARGAKVTVFCHYIETAKKLKEGLQKRLRRIAIETTAEKDGPELDRILQQFAPIANGVLPEDRNPNDSIQVLIATGALSEGFNLQDSNILVNYDLPWTVLQLAQRMGRLLRPWDTPREVYIYNFVPSTMDHPKLRHARRWQSRLQERSEQHRSFAQIPVLIRQESGAQAEQGYQMEKLARELYIRDDENLDLDEVLEFIHNADSLNTSTFYKDLANIANQAEITRLPAGIRSARVSNGKKRLFVLFRQGSRQVHAGLFDASGKLVKEGDRREVAMQAIRCDVNEPKAPAMLYPEDDVFDEWIERARIHWAEMQGIAPNRLQIICAMALLPHKG